MKKLFSFLTFLMLFLGYAGSVSAQDNYIWFPEDVVYLESGADREYTQEIWYEGSAPGVEHFYGPLPYASAYQTDYDYNAEVISGNLVVTYVGYIENQVGVKVTFTGDKGAIKITAMSNGLWDGNLYSCNYILYYGGSSKRWDFNLEPFTVKGDSWWWGTETHMTSTTTNPPAYTPFNYPIHYSDNGDTGAGAIIEEATGLKFETAAGHFGYHNPEPNHNIVNKKLQTVYDETSDANIETRFICFSEGSKIYIPSSVFSGYSYPRVRIKMNRDGNTTLNLKIHNAKDAVGNVITCGENETADYGIGGCTWWGYKNDAEHKNKFDYLYRGEYHFQIIDKTKDFCIEVPSGISDWLMIYSIEVYDSEEMITENSVVGNWYQFLTTKYTNKSGGVVKDEITGPGVFTIHYSGKAERTTLSNCTTSGTVGTLGDKTGDNFINRFQIEDINKTYTPVKGEYGTFRFRLDVRDHNRKYVTDYAYRTMSCGVIENKQYPYTWDFTDIKTYLNSPFCDDKGLVTAAADKMAKEATMGYAQQPQNNYETGVTYIPRNLWENGGLRVANEAGNYNVMFCDGSQLWYGTTIIPETAGLAFLPNNFDGSYNGAMTITNGGLKMDQNLRDWWKWRVMVPQVDNSCTIYVRAKKLRSDTYFHVGYKYGDTNNKDADEPFETGAISADKKARLVATDGDDVIYAIPGPEEGTKNVTLFFNGVEVHKIAVSTDNKHVNKYGWATESRDHVIDPELTAYFSGEDFEHCTVTAVNYQNKSVTLLRNLVENKKVLKKSSGGDNNASIIHNKNNAAVDILAINDGFHLFVPDIHDYVKNEVANNEGTYNQKTTYGHAATMVAQLNEGDVPATKDGKTNFVLTYDVAYVEHGEQGSSSDIGYVGFFRVQSNGVHSPGNQGYLPIQLGANDYTNQFTLSWADDVDGIDATIADNTAIVKDNVFYNINGQKINGVPTQRGIYIINGKKIVVK